MRQRIPILLEELKQLARKNNLPEPNAECKAGWCLQCQCSASKMNQIFGDIEYIITPSIPPVPGTILPCISRRLVMTHDLKELYELASISGAPRCQLLRRNPVWARRCYPEEFGTIHKAMTVGGAFLKETVLDASSVIIKQTMDLPIGVSEAVIGLDVFTARYGTEPGYQFIAYKDANGANAIEVSAQFVADLMVDGEEVYVKHNKEVFTLVPGDVITASGAIIRKELLSREFELVRHTQLKTEGDQEPNVFR